jgi:hypothetical protein
MSVMVVFTCPQTARPVQVAIVRGDGGLNHAKKKTVQIACMHCGSTHVWNVDEGRIASGIEPMPRHARVP